MDTYLTTFTLIILVSACIESTNPTQPTRPASSMTPPDKKIYEPTTTTTDTTTTTTTTDTTTTTIKGKWISENQIHQIHSLHTHDTTNSAYIKGYNNCKKDIYGILHI